MKTLILGLLERYKALATYFLASATVAVADIALVHVLQAVIPASIVLTNSISVIVTSVVHYIWTSKKAFESAIDIRSAAIYLTTFIIGLSIQDAVVWVCFETMSLSLFVSKLASLAVSFFILYGLRKFLYGKFGKSRKRSAP
jgi:putative flippase GtrA